MKKIFIAVIGVICILSACKDKEAGETPTAEGAPAGQYAQYSPLGSAALDKDFTSVKKLISGGADVNAPDKPLVLAVTGESESADIATYLVKSGARVNETNADGVTPLDMAAAWGNLAAVKLLVKNGADVNYCNPGISGEEQKHCAPVLYSAVLFSHDRPQAYEVIKFLTDNGASVTLADKNLNYPDFGLIAMTEGKKFKDLQTTERVAKIRKLLKERQAAEQLKK